jgi:hypothetical protein
MLLIAIATGGSTIPSRREISIVKGENRRFFEYQSGEQFGTGLLLRRVWLLVHFMREYPPTHGPTLDMTCAGLNITRIRAAVTMAVPPATARKS